MSAVMTSLCHEAFTCGCITAYLAAALANDYLVGPLMSWRLLDTASLPNRYLLEKGYAMGRGMDDDWQQVLEYSSLALPKSAYAINHQSYRGNRKLLLGVLYVVYISGYRKWNTIHSLFCSVASSCTST